MRIEISDIKITLSSREAIIVVTVLKHFGEEDPYGEASNELGIDINEVVNTIRHFEEPLRRITDVHVGKFSY